MMVGGYQCAVFWGVQQAALVAQLHHSTVFHQDVVRRAAGQVECEGDAALCEQQREPGAHHESVQGKPASCEGQEITRCCVLNAGGGVVCRRTRVWPSRRKPSTCSR